MSVAVSEAQAVQQAAREYFESYFEGDAERMRAVLHPRLVKREFLDELGDVEDLAQTADDMVGVAAGGRGRRFTGPERAFDVEVFEIYGDIATAVVRSALYREYLHLACVAGEWRIVSAFYAAASERTTR
ncbi:MAG: nuclear transport factor 2 family protein [Actinomycetota bacterium]